MKTKTVVFATLSVLVMAFIFLMSSLDAAKSRDLSNSVTRIILNIIEPGQHESENTAEKGSEKTDTHSADTASDSPESIQTSSTVLSFGGDYNPVPEKEWFGISRRMFKNFIRKAAHFLLFMLLGVFVFMTAASYGDSITLKCVLLSLGVCAVYAMFDEFHQLFVPGRAADGRLLRCASRSCRIGWRKRLWKGDTEKERLKTHIFVPQSTQLCGTFLQILIKFIIHL